MARFLLLPLAGLLAALAAAPAGAAEALADGVLAQRCYGLDNERLRQRGVVEQLRREHPPLRLADLGGEGRGGGGLFAPAELDNYLALMRAAEARFVAAGCEELF
ncbi:hypothetical protein [Roseomonas elaeocarpi]|uniref:Uncharacterized protein n=1 Tax=Roseomonas elaeocarpi TaxID=907779 RepID=A0ABV6JRF5_9PROT